MLIRNIKKKGGKIKYISGRIPDRFYERLLWLISIRIVGNTHLVLLIMKPYFIPGSMVWTMLSAICLIKQ